MSSDVVKILDGNTFVASDGRGDVEASLTDPTMPFSFDTRFLSRWVLTVNGERLDALIQRKTSSSTSSTRQHRRPSPWA